MSNQNSETKKSKSGKSLVVTAFGVVLVLIVILACVFLKSCGKEEIEPIVTMPTESVTEPEEEVLDTDVKTVEQLKKLLAYPGELEITLNTDLVLTESLDVEGVKKISGTGMLMAPLGKCDKYYMLNLQKGADLTVTDITFEGNATADAIAVQKGAKVHIENVDILWPFQYGVCVYGEAVIKDARVEHALSAGVVVYENGKVTLDGAEIVDSFAEAMYVDSGTAHITGGTKITDSGNQGVVNRGIMIIDDASITGSTQYSVINYGELEIAYKGDKEDGVINLSDNLKGAIFNYNIGTATVKDILASNNKKSSVVSQGKMVLTESEICHCGTNAIYNNGTLEASKLNVHDTSSQGIYNISPGKLNVTDCDFKDLGKRGIHNEGGKIEGSNITITNCGTFGLANNTDEYGKKGTIDMSNISISGCRTNVYNQGKGVSTKLSNSVLYKSREVSVYVSYGSVDLNSVRILGTLGEKQYGLFTASNTTVKIRGNSEITGCTSSGINNRGNLTIDYCRIHDNHSHRSGGGIYTQGVVKFNGGEIYNNTATSGGGGVSVVSDANDSSRIGKFYMTGGKIYNNTAETRGGGIVVGAGSMYGDTFLAPYASITGGVIYSNKAESGTGVSTTADIKVGGSVHFIDNTLEIREGYVVTMSSLTSHSENDKLVIAAYGDDGAVVLATGSKKNTTALLKKITAEAPTMEFLPDEKNIVIGKVVIEELDMTGAEEVTVSTFQQLKEAVESTAGGSKKIVKIADNIAMLDTIKVPASATVQIIDDGTARNLTRDTTYAEGAFFEVPSSGVFGLAATGDNTLVLDGKGDTITAAKALVENKGVLVMDAGVSMTNTVNSDGPGALLNNGSAVVRGAISGCSGTTGGAIDNKAGAVLTVDDGAVLSNNTASKAGGAICNAGELNVAKATFTGNHTTGGNSGAIHGATDSTITIDGATFENNYATNGHGGAVYATASALNVSNSTFKKNYVESAGEKNGGALGMNTNTVAQINNCTFEENHVTGGKGGAMFAGSGVQATITGGSFVKNVSANNSGVVYGEGGAQVSFVDGTLIKGNSAANGALAYINGYTLNVEGATITENTSTGAGGVIYGNIKDDFGLTMTDCTITNNSSSNNGGVLYIKGNGTKKEITNCTFSGNTATKNGQTAYIEGAGLTMKDCTITAAAKPDVVMVAGADNHLNVSGKSVLGSVKLNDNTIHLTAALAAGSDITIVPASYAEGTAVVTEESTGLLEDAVQYIKVAENGTDEWSVDEAGKLKRMNAEETTFKAAIVGKQSYDTLEDAVSNAVDGDVIQINGDYIANNEIAISGKSITIESEADAAYTITRGTSLTANAVFVVNDGAGLTLTNITVDGNGTAAADNVKPLVDNLGVFTLSADAALTNNVNTSNGGGLFNRGSGISHIYGTISNCSAENGGAMRVNAGTVNIYDGAKISGNAAGNNGGGIHANGGTVNVYKAEFNGNEAANVSGAIHIGGATVNIDGAVFTNNSADKQGGISYINKGKTITISNITATGNTSPEGNAFYIAANTVLTLSDCNIVSASGTNIVLNNQALHVSGTSVLGNVTLNGNTIHLTGELATGSDITIIPASYTEGTVVVTEEVAGLLENAVQYIRVAEVSGADWVVTAEGTLDNQAYVVSLGTNKYQTVAEAISAAVSGDTVTLLTSVSEATVTVPAGVTLDGGDYTITGDIVLADGGLMKNINITGNVTVQGNGDLTTAKVSGKVTVSAGKSVTVGAGFDADTVELKSGATIKLNAALASDATVKVTAEQTAEGTVILTGDASLIAAESGKFKLESADSTLQLGSDGKIEKIPFKAIIVGKQEYDKLEDAVANAEDGDVIQITDNYTVNSQINIEKAITITGAEGITPVILCGSRTNGSAVFNVTGSLTLENITVDGNGLACNRAMVINAGTFTLAEDATLTNAQNITSRPSALDNQDNANAKAYIYGTISNCSGAYTAVENRAKATLVIGDGATFKGNTQTNTKYGGGAVYNSGTLTVGAATFENNTAAGNGGAIYSKTAVTITGAAFTGNTAANGGALYLGGEATHALTSCVFNNNTATGDGQAVYAYKCTLTMSGCTINSSEEITDEAVKLDSSTMN